MTPSMFLSRIDLVPSSRSLWISASSFFLCSSTVIVSSWEDACYVSIRGYPAIECIDESCHLVAASRNAPLLPFYLLRRIRPPDGGTLVAHSCRQQDCCWSICASRTIKLMQNKQRAPSPPVFQVGTEDLRYQTCL